MRTAVKIIGRRFARTEFSGNTCSRRYLSNQEVDGSIEVRTSGLESGFADVSCGRIGKF